MPAQSRTAIRFANRDGVCLFGIVEEPVDVPVRDEAILLLSPGVKMRVAPHRLYNKLAARFTAMGFRVLRFDFHGLGDAEGEAGESLLADLYGATQLGRYVPDTIAAMDWMERTYGTKRFIAAGLCGGAITGMLAAEVDSRIRGLVALSIPAILDSSTIDAAAFMTDAQLTQLRSGYLERLRLTDTRVWQSWFRFLTFQSDYRQIARSVLKPLLARVRTAPPERPEPAARPADNTNPMFAPAFLAMVRTSRPILLLFAETDRLYAEFEAKFMAVHGGSLEAHRRMFDVHVVAKANHIFSFAEWQQEALDLCSRWLAERLANGRREPVPQR